MQINLRTAVAPKMLIFVRGRNWRPGRLVICSWFGTYLAEVQHGLDRARSSSRAKWIKNYQNVAQEDLLRNVDMPDDLGRDAE